MGGARAARDLRRLTPWAIATSVLSIAALMVWYQARHGVDVLDSLAALDARVVPAALGLHILAHLFWSARFWTLAAGLGARLGPLGAVRIIVAGAFGAAVTPGRLGAEALRLAILMRGGADGPRASRIVLADRASDVVFFVTLGSASALLLTRLFGDEAVALQGLAVAAVVGLAGFAAVVVLGLAVPALLGRAAQGLATGLWRIAGRRPPDVTARVAAFLTSVRDGLQALAREGTWRVVVAGLLTIGLWLSEFGVLWLLLRGFGHAVAFAHVFAAGVMITMLAALPITVGGAGVAEFAAIVMLGPLAPGLTPAFVLVWRALTYYYDVVVGGAVAAYALPKGEAPARSGDRAGDAP